MSVQNLNRDLLTTEPGFHYVKNAATLLDHGCAALRRDALAIFEKVLADVNPFDWCQRQLAVANDQLWVGDLRLPLARTAKIWFLGAGKASYEIARSVEESLGERLHAGLVVCKGHHGALRRIEVWQAHHPVPSQSSIDAGREVLARALLPVAGDVVICGITGGSSALMTVPADGLELSDLQSLTEILLTCGADIFEINAVRKHVSLVGGGRLALALAPGVHLVNLTVSDVIGDALDYVTDPTVADTSSMEDARATLDKYRLWDRVTPATRDFLRRGGPMTETPKHLPWPASHTVLLLSAASAAEAARKAAQALGYHAVVLSSSFDGESQSLGHNFAAIASEVIFRGSPVGRPCALIGGGETIVRMSGFGGLGGPNQEFALAGALRLPAGAEAVLLGADTDGTDGPTDIAGGLCDTHTRRRALDLEVDIHRALDQHDATNALLKLGDAISTGPTGSNVNDLKLLLVR